MGDNGRMEETITAEQPLEQPFDGVTQENINNLDPQELLDLYESKANEEKEKLHRELLAKNPEEAVASLLSQLDLEKIVDLGLSAKRAGQQLHLSPSIIDKVRYTLSTDKNGTYQKIASKRLQWMGHDELSTLVLSHLKDAYEGEVQKIKGKLEQNKEKLMSYSRHYHDTVEAGKLLKAVIKKLYDEVERTRERIQEYKGKLRTKADYALENDLLKMKTDISQKEADIKNAFHKLKAEESKNKSARASYQRMNQIYQRDLSLYTIYEAYRDLIDYYQVVHQDYLSAKEVYAPDVPVEEHTKMLNAVKEAIVAQTPPVYAHEPVLDDKALDTLWNLEGKVEEGKTKPVPLDSYLVDADRILNRMQQADL